MTISTKLLKIIKSLDKSKDLAVESKLLDSLNEIHSDFIEYDSSNIMKIKNMEEKLTSLNAKSKASDEIVQKANREIRRFADENVKS